MKPVPFKNSIPPSFAQNPCISGKYGNTNESTNDMILPTMTDDDRAYEVVRATDWLCDAFSAHKAEIIDKYRRGTRFPYYQRIRLEDDKRNDWKRRGLIKR